MATIQREDSHERTQKHTNALSKVSASKNKSQCVVHRHGVFFSRESTSDVDGGNSSALKLQMFCVRTFCKVIYCILFKFNVRNITFL